MWWADWALDSKTGIVVLKLLRSMCENHNKTVVVVTHNQNIAKIADTIISVKNGKIGFYYIKRYNCLKKTYTKYRKTDL